MITVTVKDGEAGWSDPKTLPGFSVRYGAWPHPGELKYLYPNESIDCIKTALAMSKQDATNKLFDMAQEVANRMWGNDIDVVRSGKDGCLLAIRGLGSHVDWDTKDWKEFSLFEDQIRDSWKALRQGSEIALHIDRHGYFRRLEELLVDDRVDILDITKRSEGGS